MLNILCIMQLSGKKDFIRNFALQIQDCGMQYKIYRTNILFDSLLDNVK